MVKKDMQAAANWSARSQASLLREVDLERQRAILLRDIEREQKKIRFAEERRDKLAQHRLEGGGGPDLLVLERYVAHIRASRDMVELYQRQLKSVETKIADCTPTPETAALRRKNQQTLAATVEGRLALDAQIAAAAIQLKKLLEDRAGLTKKITDSAKALEVELDPDQERFDVLLSSLPANMAAESEGWVDWLFGQREGLVRAVVADEQLILPETLAHSGVYQQGETVELSESQFGELSRSDRPAPTHEQPWRCQPPSVVSVEAYKELSADAKRKGLSFAEALFWADITRQEENKRRYLQNQQQGKPFRIVEVNK